MKKFNLFLLLLLLGAASVKAQYSPDFYALDTQHSTLSFKIRHIGFSNVRGNFGLYEGNIYFDPDDLLKTSASLVISTESLETGAGGRNGVLKEYFFQVEKYPYITFNSNRVVKRDGYLLAGDLTIGGVTKLVEIPFELISGPAQDQWKHQRITLSGELIINRRDYDIYYRGNEFWDKVVEDNVKIEIEVGARVYNSLETVFPFRENAIGRLAFEAYQKGSKDAMESKVNEVLRTEKLDPKKYITSLGQILRGATHLRQAIGAQSAVEYVELILGQQILELEDNMKSELWARKSQYLLVLKKFKEAKEAAERSLYLDQNALGMEVLKQVIARMN